MLFNVSVIDSDYKPKMHYYWIKQAQQDFCLMAVRKDVNGELALYASNCTMDTHAVEYTVTAYDENCNGKIIASGRCVQKENSSELIQKTGEIETPELWIIKWIENGEEFLNHAITKKVDLDVLKRWAKIISDECGYQLNELIM